MRAPAMLVAAGIFRPADSGRTEYALGAGSSRQLLEAPVPQAKLGEMGERVAQVLDVGAGRALTLAHQLERPGERQLAGELPVGAIGEIDQGRHGAAIGELDRPDLLDIDAVILYFAPPQIAAHRAVVLVRQPVGQTPAGAARQQAEDQAGFARRAAIMLGVDAEGAM